MSENEEGKMGVMMMKVQQVVGKEWVNNDDE